MEYDEERRDVVAGSMVLLAEEQNAAFRRGDVILRAPVAMMSPRLVGDLMRLAAFSANLHHEIFARSPGARKTLPGEDIFLAAAFDHAIEIAPRSALEDGTPVVDLERLAGWVQYIETSQGAIAIDHDLVSRVTIAARDRMAPGMSEPARPTGAA